jgi:hypothetical protein
LTEPYRGILWYNAKKKAYAVVEHNLGSNYQEILEKHRSQGLPAHLFEHKKHHHTEDADNCRPCDQIARKVISSWREAGIIKKLLGDRNV